MTDENNKNKIVNLVSKKDKEVEKFEPSPELIEYLEGLLEEAKSGTLVALCTVAINQETKQSPTEPKPFVYFSDIEDLSTFVMTYDIALKPTIQESWATLVASKLHSSDDTKH